jgi:putative transposase
VSERYVFIDAEKATTTANGEKKYTVTLMCRWLEVSSSGFYAWAARPASAQAVRRERLTVLIKHVFTGSESTYGYRRVHAQLARWGQSCSPEFVRALMRAAGLVPCQPRPWRHSLTAGAGAGTIPDLLARNFTAIAPGAKMVGDITNIRTWQGWLFLATVIDCHTKAVIGWATGDNYRTPLISAAIGMAVRNHDIHPDAIFHSDRGSNYMSAEFAAALAGHGIRQSVGQSGVCYDNAMAESFFAVLKNELVHRTVYPTREHARRDIVRYIEMHYNTKRLHSGLGYRTPREVHDEYLNRREAA